MVRMAGLEERMLGWPEFRNPRDRYAYSSPEAIGEIIPGIRDHLHRWDDPVEISSGPYIPSEDTSEIVPLVEPSGGGITGMMHEIPGYMDPRTGQTIYPQEDWLSGGGTDVAGLFDRLKSGGSGGGVPKTKNKWGVLDSKLVESGDMTLDEFMEKWRMNPRDYEQLPQAFASPKGKIDGAMLAEAGNTPVMWEPEDLSGRDIYVNPDGIRNDGTRGSTIEPYTEEMRNQDLFKSLPKDPGGRVIWEMVPVEYQEKLRKYEGEPRPYRIPVIPFQAG